MPDAAGRNIPAEWAEHWDRLPDYAALLTARHEAHGDHFRAVVADLPMRSTDTVLDVAIGDGFFTDLLSRRCPRGRVVGLDVDHGFLELADDAYVDRRRAEMVSADTYRLPFGAETFDLVWCAHSLRSLPDAVGAVREWARVLKPGGRVAVLENDGLHGVILPWPPEAELAFYRAKCEAEGETASRIPGGLHAGRRLSRIATESGLRPVVRRTYAWDVTPPAGAADRDYIAAHLQSLREATWSRLTEEDRSRYGPLISPGSGRFLADRDDLEATFLDTVLVASKGPDRAAERPHQDAGDNP